MNKEEIINRMLAKSPHNEVFIIKDFDEFFESNVCIPKGKNRHLDADVLHEWIEGAECEYKNTLGRVDGWKKLYFPLQSYRLKPPEPEPIYEWKWIDIENEDEARYVNGGEFMTEEEAQKYSSFGKIKKITSTMKERK